MLLPGLLGKATRYACVTEGKEDIDQQEKRRKIKNGGLHLIMA